MESERIFKSTYFRSQDRKGVRRRETLMRHLYYLLCISAVMHTCADALASRVGRICTEDRIGVIGLYIVATNDADMVYNYQTRNYEATQGIHIQPNSQYVRPTDRDGSILLPDGVGKHHLYGVSYNMLYRAPLMKVEDIKSTCWLIGVCADNDNTDLILNRNAGMIVNIGIAGQAGRTTCSVMLYDVRLQDDFSSEQYDSPASRMISMFRIEVRTSAYAVVVLRDIKSSGEGSGMEYKSGIAMERKPDICLLEVADGDRIKARVHYRQNCEVNVGELFIALP